MTWPPWCKLEGCSLIWIWGVQAREPWSLKRLATWLSKTEQVLALKYQVTWLWKERTMHLAENVGCQESAHSVAVNVKPIQSSSGRIGEYLGRTAYITCSHSSGLESSWIEEITFILFRHVEEILGVRFCLGGQMPGAMRLCAPRFIADANRPVHSQERCLPTQNDLGLWFAALSL